MIRVAIGGALGVADPWGDALEHEGEEPMLSFDPTEQIVPIVRRLTYRFDGRASVEQTAELATTVPVAFARTGQLVWIVQRTDGLSSTAGFRLECDNVSVVEEDPARTFVGTRAGTTTTVNLSTAIPFFQTVPLTAGFGPELSVMLRWVQGSVVATRDCLVTLSAYLLLRAQ